MNAGRSLPRRLLPVAGGILLLGLFWVAFYGSIWGRRRFVGWDLLHYNYPLDRYILSHLSWRAGAPKYDPFTYNGMDFIGNINAAPFYPPKFAMEAVLKLLNKQLTYSMYQTFMLVHVLFFSIGTFLLARRFSRSWVVALFASLTLTYAGYSQGQLEHFYFFGTLAWAPLAFYGLHRALSERKEGGYLIYAAASAMMLLVGYPPLFGVTQLFILAAAFVVELLSGRRLSRGQLARVVFAGLIVGLCTAPVTLPFLALNRTAVPLLERPSFALQTILSAFVPNAVGSLSGAYHVGGTGVTNSYNFAGLTFYVVPIAAAFLLLKKEQGRRTAGIALLVAGVLLWLFVYTPVLQTIGVPFFRPYVFGASLLMVLVMIPVFAGALIARSGRLGIAVVVLVTIASIALTYRYNRPAYFNSLPSSKKSLNSAVIGNQALTEAIKADGSQYAILVDQSAVRGKLDNWPRVLQVRSFSGYDAAVQRSYLDLLARRGLQDVPHNRNTFAINRPDFDWLADNGVKYFVSSKRWKWPAQPDDPKRIWHGATYAMYELANPRPLFSSPGDCARIESYALTADSIRLVADVSTEGCSIRTTTNYTTDWRAPHGLALTPLNEAVGFTIGNLHAGSQQITLTYTNPWYGRAKYLLLAGLLMLAVWIGWLAKLAVRRRNAPAEPMSVPALEPEPAGRLAEESS